jgi:hypothetical protein
LFVLAEESLEIAMPFDDIHDFHDVTDISEEDQIVAMGCGADIGKQVRASPTDRSGQTSQMATIVV